jgi:cytochrome P450
MTLQDLASLDQTALRCPAASYGELREKGVHFEEAVNAYVVSSYQDVDRVLHDVETFSSRNAVGNPVFATPPPPDPTALRPLLLLSDPPEHRTRRSMVNQAFTVRRLRSWEPQVAKLVNATVAGLKDLPDVDLVRDLAKPLPIRVITWVLGIPDDDVARFREWSETIVRSVGSHRADDGTAAAVRVQFAEYLSETLADRERNPQDDVLTTIAQADLEARQKVSFVAELLVAGNITTTHHISNSVLLLARHEGLFQQLRKDQKLIQRFVEESLRLEAPIQGFYRYTTKNTEIGGVAVPAGSRVFVLYGSANHDPAAWPNCPALDLDRPNISAHFAFGRGNHTCLGAGLARLEGRLVTEALVNQLDGFELLGDLAQLEYAPSFINHGLAGLPARLRFRSE